MAATVLNGPGTPMLPRGRAVALGSLTAVTQALQFTIPQLMGTPNGLDLLTITTVGGPGSVLVLECSIDSGTSWFSVAGRTTGSAFGTTTVSSDPAVVAAVSYDVSGLAGGLFRIGLSAITSGTAAITALIS